MKLVLPNGEKIELQNNITIEEKIKNVDKLTSEWYNSIIIGWKNEHIKYFLDGLANYLVWHKEEDMKNKTEKEVLSIYSIEQMTGKRKNKETPFSCLSNENKEKLFGETRGAENG